MIDCLKMTSGLRYTDAVLEDSELLSETAIMSKKFWGYTDEMIQLWKTDLEITNTYILKNKVVKVYAGASFIGFFAIKWHADENPEIDHLWLKPENIRQNYGREIFNFVKDSLWSEGFHKATLTAEPNAKGFYEKMGGTVIGKFESKIAGRFLEIYEFRLQPASQ